jgi:beta-lactamase class A
MVSRRSRFVCAVALLACGFRAVEPAPRQRTDLARELNRIAASTSGTLGARVLDVESGTGAGVNADDWFPMMSVYKLPIVIHALRQAEAGTLDLSRAIRLRSEDRRPGFSPLAREIEKTGPRTASVRELISSVTRVSDNTASDTLLQIVGGPSAVAATLRSLGLSGINVDRYELEFAADYYGLCCVGRMRPFSLERFARQVDQIPLSARRKAAAAFVLDRRDSATPDAMATLLARLVRGELLNQQHTAWLLAEMTEMHARDTRLRAGVPPGTRVALRPGTSGETDGIRAAQNDTAVITLPGGRGQLVIAAFLKGSRGPDADRDATLAAVARVAYRWATEPEQ